MYSSHLSGFITLVKIVARFELYVFSTSQIRLENEIRKNIFFFHFHCTGICDPNYEYEPFFSHFRFHFLFPWKEEQKKAFWYIFGIELRYLVSLSALFFCKNYEFLLTFLSKSIRCVLLSIRILQWHKIKCSMLAQSTSNYLNATQAKVDSILSAKLFSSTTMEIS